MHRFILFVFSFIFSWQIQAANDPPPSVGARAVALGHAYHAVRADFWSLYHNPAGIANIEGVTAGAYVVRRFNLKELTSGSAGLVLPFLEGDHSLGLDFTTFGFAAYRENRLGIAYATTLLEKVSLGVKFNYANVSIPNYGSESSLYLDVGVNTAISKQLSLGFSATNVNRAKLGHDPAAEELPSVVTAGLAYQPSAKVLVVADLQKDIDHPLSVRAGLEYFLNDVIIARMGVSTEPLSWHAGLGLLTNGLKIDFAFGYTERLGYSPHISLSYGF